MMGQCHALNYGSFGRAEELSLLNKVCEDGLVVLEEILSEMRGEVSHARGGVKTPGRSAAEFPRRGT